MTEYAARHFAVNRFRSFGFPDRFIGHRDFPLFVEQVNTDLDRKDATFKVVPGLSPEPSGPR
ncbi:AbfB domain-containing protein [Streptomyces netropsis]|uniref:Alpha-L-arabinofuranosidase B arabinose-binding domain-containing protein n=1 Tax=Streptomyces netropsis TaxID=55404 RepID=A0A7W7LFT0_STRNE|nr:AbfB domain-containing protein [Streptomyces netropsis]MBB4888883.1 hypothetical protein [Streptomyces netropsis]GGR11589.1 hypothetical protein GCM10010219_16030 [Streptomyces netropsis]